MIPFHRPPECVPDRFNLLDFFDIPTVFGCQPPGEGARVQHVTFVTLGKLDDCRSFAAEATRSGGAGRLTNVGVNFG